MRIAPKGQAGAQRWQEGHSGARVGKGLSTQAFSSPKTHPEHVAHTAASIRAAPTCGSPARPTLTMIFIGCDGHDGCCSAQALPCTAAFTTAGSAATSSQSAPAKRYRADSRWIRCRSLPPNPEIILQNGGFNCDFGGSAGRSGRRRSMDPPVRAAEGYGGPLSTTLLLLLGNQPCNRFCVSRALCRCAGARAPGRWANISSRTSSRRSACDTAAATSTPSCRRKARNRV